ncbi:hypothetical protein GCM10017673_56140 [Streptosporangium violaceochromogenes]|nr:hypothetical protein GCM10017673_56140 [Streptosporangium violaceochromogenes]
MASPLVSGLRAVTEDRSRAGHALIEHPTHGDRFSAETGNLPLRGCPAVSLFPPPAHPPSRPSNGPGRQEPGTGRRSHTTGDGVTEWSKPAPDTFFPSSTARAIPGETPAREIEESRCRTPDTRPPGP